MTFELSEEAKTGVRKKQTEDRDRDRQHHRDRDRDRDGEKRHRYCLLFILESPTFYFILEMLRRFKRKKGERREGAPSRIKRTMIMISMTGIEKDVVIIPPLIPESMKGTLSQGGVKVKMICERKLF